MEKPKNSYPYRMLGSKLKQMREKTKESIAEVSGAVEIDIDALQAIETGSERPTEDILLLLISHFSIKEDEASKLWKLAGYDNKKVDDDLAAVDADKSTAMVMPMDLRIVYTDMVHVVANDFGLVMNFMQTSGVGNKPLAIARVGMSREHAQSVLEVLQKTMAEIQPKALPAPKQKDSSTDKA